MPTTTPEKPTPWTLGQWVTFFFFYTVPGLVLMGIMGLTIWALVLLPATYGVHRLLLWRRAAPKQEGEDERGQGDS